MDILLSDEFFALRFTIGAMLILAILFFLIRYTGKKRDVRNTNMYK